MTLTLIALALAIYVAGFVSGKTFSDWLIRRYPPSVSVQVRRPPGRTP